MAGLYLKGREDYSAWKFKMLMYLIHVNLWNYIVGYHENDTTPIEVKVRNDKITLAKIFLTLDSPAIMHVKSSKSAKEARNALAGSLEDKSLSRTLALEKKLYRHNLNDFQNMDLFKDAVMSTVQDLADIGKVIEDSSVAAILLRGLTSRFDPLIMALESSTGQISTEFIKSKLLIELSRSAQSEPSTPDAA